MKKTIILKELEKEVESIFLHAQALQEYKKKYPSIADIVAKEFQLDTYYNSDFVQDDIENIKLRLYASLTYDSRRAKKREEKKQKELIKKLNTNK